MIHWRKSFYREFWKKLNISVFIGKTDIFVMLTILAIWAFYMSKKNPNVRLKQLLSVVCFQIRVKKAQKKSFIVLVIHWRKSFYREFWKKLNMNVVISKGVPHPHDLQNRIFYDLVMIMTWHLGWGDFRAWQTFSKFLVNRCWLNFDIWCLICQNRPKNAKKGNCWLKPRGVVIYCLQPWYLGESWPKGYRTT